MKENFNHILINNSVVSNLKQVLSVYRISYSILRNCNYMETSITEALGLIFPSCEVELHSVCIDVLQHIIEICCFCLSDHMMSYLRRVYSSSYNLRDIVCVNLKLTRVSDL